MRTLSGVATSCGFVTGPVFLHVGTRELAVREYRIPESQVGAELARYREARAETRRQLEGLIADISGRVREDEARIFENHLVILEDDVVIKAIEKAIRTECINAESAMHRVVGEFRKTFERMNDPYFRERVRDIDDIERRMLRVFLGKTEETGLSRITRPVIIVADDLTPSETVSVPRELILGFATDRGSATSHVALLARALGIPAVTGLGDVTAHVAPGDKILLDGTSGTVTVHPDHETREQFARLIWRARELKQMLEEARSAPEQGLDVRLLANIQLGVPFGGLAAFGAEGVGLYRTEYLWMSRGEAPTENEQTAAYSEAVKAVAQLGPEARITIRALDIGGDKALKGRVSREPNPFLGNRSIRFLLSHRDVFRTQLRAILKASAFGKTAVLYPMVATVEEVREANAELRQAMEQLRMAGIPFDERIPMGAMIETPAAALNAAAIAREVTFFSIGTNDLVQYAMAADRGNAAVSHLYQPTNPAVVKLVDMTVRAARAACIPTCVCGESASDPVTGVLWASLGVSSLSMSATFLPVLRKVLRTLTPADAEQIALEVRGMLDVARAAEIYAHVRGRLVEKMPDLEEIQSFFAPVVSVE